MFAYRPLPRWCATLLGVIEQQVDVARSDAKRSKQQCDLPTMMHAVCGRVLHQRSQGSGAFLATRVREFDGAIEVVVFQRR